MIEIYIYSEHQRVAAFSSGMSQVEGISFDFAVLANFKQTDC